MEPDEKVRKVSKLPSVPVSGKNKRVEQEQRGEKVATNDQPNRKCS